MDLLSSIHLTFITSQPIIFQWRKIMAIIKRVIREDFEVVLKEC